VRAIPQRLYPFEGQYLDRDGIRMHYIDEGAGDAVVMVHGNPTWSFYYRNLVMALRDQRRCVAPDHIGCGLSDKPAESRYTYRLEQRIDDLGALLDHLALDQVDLVVHDWGGLIGLGWAVQHPERVRRLVVLNTAAFHLPAGKRVPWQLRLVRNTPLGVFLVRGFNAFARGATRAAVTATSMSREVRDAYCAPYDSWANRIATARFVQDIPLEQGDPGYQIVSETARGLDALAGHPIMICWGMRDFVFDHHFLAEFERVWPGAVVHTYPEAGHYVLEDAGEKIIPLVSEFLST
jgi:pimeloyl-ACP methyl ester carboxylesterase